MRTKVLVRKLCRDILNLSMALSEETKADIYVDYAPHVDTFTICIYEKGFLKSNPMDQQRTEIFLTEHNAQEKLAEIRETLREALRHENVG